MVYGDLFVFYEHIGANRKSSDFEKNNKEILKDGLWSPGEKLILTGNDSAGTFSSSVSTSVGLENQTSNNYGFSSGTEAEILIYQENSANLKQIVFKKSRLVSENLKK